MWSPRLWRALAAHRTPLPLMVKHAYGRCSTSTQLSTQPLVTGHIWRQNTPPNSSKNGGRWLWLDPEGFLSSFWFWGGGQTIPWFFIFFPYLFYHRFLVSNCSKFCVKQMGSTVILTQTARHTGLRGRLSWPAIGPWPASGAYIYKVQYALYMVSPASARALIGKDVWCEVLLNY